MELGGHERSGRAPVAGELRARRSTCIGNVLTPKSDRDREDGAGARGVRDRGCLYRREGGRVQRCVYRETFLGAT